jgi:hypothetical protein
VGQVYSVLFGQKTAREQTFWGHKDDIGDFIASLKAEIQF